MTILYGHMPRELFQILNTYFYKGVHWCRVCTHVIVCIGVGCIHVMVCTGVGCVHVRVCTGVRCVHVRVCTSVGCVHVRVCTSVGLGCALVWVVYM